jgi:hypothetical protein
MIGERLTSQNSGHHMKGDLWRRCRLGISPDSSTIALWQSYQQRHQERIGGMDEEMRMLRIQYL